MAPVADRHRLLHGAPADAQQPRRIGNRERSGSRERGIFPERMAGDELRLRRELESRLRPSTRMPASDTAMSAGCAFSVSVSCSAGPSHMTAVSFSPSAASTSSKTSRAGAKASAKAFPMPTVWLPWPGKMNAFDMALRREIAAVRHRTRTRCQAAPINRPGREGCLLAVKLADLIGRRDGQRRVGSRVGSSVESEFDRMSATTCADSEISTPAKPYRALGQRLLN